MGNEREVEPASSVCYCTEPEAELRFLLIHLLERNNNTTFLCL